MSAIDDGADGEANSDDLNGLVAKSRISLDVLAAADAIQARSRDDADRYAFAANAALPMQKQIHTLVHGSQDLIQVIVEANARLRAGSEAARNYLLAFYLKLRAETARIDNPGATELAEHIEYLQGLGIASRTAGELAIYLLELENVEAQPFDKADEVDLRKSLMTDKFLIGALTRTTIENLADFHWHEDHCVYRISGNHACDMSLYESGRTVKCDAARVTFSATGRNIVWAVADSGIDGNHPHFRKHGNLDLPSSLEHQDLTGDDAPLVDENGHGTHVAGVIAGETCRVPPGGICGSPDFAAQDLAVRKMQQGKRGLGNAEPVSVDVIAGLAPECKLMSLKVVSPREGVRAGDLVAAIGYIRKVNSGDHLQIHGLNISLGYLFDPEWFAAGHSPLCKEVNRLVKEGVVVVVAAGNGGYGMVQKHDRKQERATHLGTISDPGNAELAITVGSVHRDSPHTFGVSYFSGKGPTADGRMKPDLVAPGERIVSASPHDVANGDVATFCERSGTSMAAPHVSGCIAAFLSTRQEFVGQPEVVKRIFKKSTTDIGRQPEFQGAGLVDVMRALQLKRF
ncbi:S8 family peptidase [Novosphingobium mangrovi (ex Hu et al. 2023)]|uniref:S8 family peptidase n=1 Tax=Novosphingobium mangrovi (ex Hu et al. 2023) TaxID=2930094 RepID=A0ABT0AIF9_9SPHN|nr:S8 family peptidase [Novosphingobium mangrovi (ex Hu et al. 2023)]MCJ1962983.1 S8 family peptidase [Novosphingobium mangrovi (ex Hu et al. 2023)]